MRLFVVPRHLDMLFGFRRRRRRRRCNDRLMTERRNWRDGRCFDIVSQSQATQTA